MRRFFAFSLLCMALLTGQVWAQDDRGTLQAFLEDSLSDAGREVRVIGFSGALSGRARFDRLTIADADGIWLTVTNAVLDWNRAALLRGALEVAELSAETVSITRLPLSEPVLASPEATPFSLPDLPVSFQIDTFDLQHLELGAPVLGAAGTFQLSGSADLTGGAGHARLQATRLDGPKGQLEMSGSYANLTKKLALNLTLTEDRNGITATLLDLPDRPDLTFSLMGDGTLSDFTADIALATEGKDRLSGQVTLTEHADQGDQQQVTQQIAVELGGDLRPLVHPQYRAFLGRDLRLTALGTRDPDGRSTLSELSLKSEALTLQGAAKIAADGWPESFGLTGTVTPTKGETVLLTLPGPETRIAGAELDLQYDAAQSDAWQLRVDLKDLETPELVLGAAQMSGEGVLSRSQASVHGRVDLALSALAPADPALSEALGSELRTALAFSWRKGDPLQIAPFSLVGDDYTLSGQMGISGVDGQIELAINGEVELAAQELSRFAALSEQPLQGAAQLRITGQVTPISGGFDLKFSGTGEDLGIGQPRLDPLIKGGTALSGRARRDSTGARIDGFRIASETAQITADAILISDASQATFGLQLDRADLVLPEVRGPMQLSGVVQQSGTRWDLHANGSAPGDSVVKVQASTDLTGGPIGTFDSKAEIVIGDLSPWADLLGQPIAGAAFLTAHTEGDLRDGTLAASLTGTGSDLRSGIAEADRLLHGKSELTAELRRDARGTISLDQITLNTAQLTADVEGQLSAALSRLRYALVLRDLGVVVEGLRGQVKSSGTLAATDGPWNIDTTLTGPGGLTAAIAGALARDASNADLSLVGTAPAGLANRFISPNLVDGSARFDLQLDGPPKLSSLSGSVQMAEGQLTLPDLQTGLNQLTVNAILSRDSARIDAGGRLTDGGQISLTGQVALSAPYNADLSGLIRAAVAQEPGLYETTLDGQVTLSGPMQGGAAITGALSLGPTELRIPDGASADAEDLPGLVHLHEPAAVRSSRNRAGLIHSQTGTSGPAYPLDLTINAPTRIFVRGRGLDAELGGSLRLSGDTENVITSGRFDLIRGRLDILGKRLTLSEASAQLQGDFDPYIRAVATTDADGTSIQILLEGLASAPEISFSSSPSLPEDEILARLLFSRSLSEISPLQALQIANAVRVLSGKGGDGIVGRLRQSFGLDDLDIASSEDGEAGLRVGKYLNDNVYTDVTVDTSGRSEINLNLSLTPSLTARGSTASDGGSSLGLFFERDY